MVHYHPINVFSLIFLPFSLSQVIYTGEIYYIRTSSTPADLCIAPCMTLPELIRSSHYRTLHFNTTLVFLPGTHELTVSLPIRDLVNFSMTSENITARIMCTPSHPSPSIHIRHCQYVNIFNLEFEFCGGIQVYHVKKFIVMNSTFSHNDVGAYYKHFSISDEEFPSDVIVDVPSSGHVGGAIAAINCESINISQSRFEGNEADYGGAIYTENSNIIIHNTIFTSNLATSGGGVFFIMESTISVGASDFFSNTGEIDGGVIYSLWSNIKIIASNFVSNVVRDSSYLLPNMWSGGGVIYCNEGEVSITNSKFYHNAVQGGAGVGVGAGGVLCSFYTSYIKIQASLFYGNNATSYAGEGGKGGVLYAFDSTKIILEESDFNSNVAANTGGVLHSDYSTIEIRKSEFNNNAATSGGVLYARQCDMIAMVGSVFHNNSATVIDRVDDVYEFLPHSEGGVLRSTHSSIIIAGSRFTTNSASLAGGALYFESSTVSLDSASVCKNNTAISEGGAWFSLNSTITICMVSIISPLHFLYLPPGGGSYNFNIVTEGADICTYRNAYGVLQIINNSARYGASYLIDSELYVEYSGNLILSNNVGSLVAFNSNVTFMGCVVFINNDPKRSNTTTNTFKEGGAMTLFQSNVFFNGNCSLLYNHAEDGGGLLSIETKVYVYGNLSIAHNIASRNGGGVYLSNSELTCLQKSTFRLDNNHAGSKGGGVHAISSAIKAIKASSMAPSYYTGAKLNFTKNVAEMGGGLSLEANAKLYILKYDAGKAKIVTIAFIANNAYSQGGAVYVDDKTNSGTCASSSRTECFFQVLTVHGEYRYESKYSVSELRSIHFSQNEANISGSTLYGGQLDRCTVSQFAEIHKRYRKSFRDGFSGVAYFKNISIPSHYSLKKEDPRTNISISSGPVKVCLCIEKKYNCSHQLQAHSHIWAKKGEAFNISLVAVDQVEQPVDATIHASLEYPESGLSEGQMTTKVRGECTNITFNIVSPYSDESLILYAVDGPCKDADLSRRVIRIDFLPCSCPIGFQISGKIGTNCTCDCHSDISQYAEFCDSGSGSFIKKSNSRAWISYTSGTNITGYLIYQNCPFDYCNSLSLPIDLSQPNGADAQCAFKRSSLLCGSCQPDLSLSLGSSRCLQCSSYWFALLIAITLAAILAGMALVALLLFLNVTVAVGALNSLIFYANVVHANKSILLPFQENNFVTVFISLLNLELGVDTCYFPGMDSYTKAWLQLAFPALIFYLVILIIIVSSYSIRFSRLIGNKDPVATLATLVLLSYAKLLQVCFESLSVGILSYPDGSSKVLWLPDATILYLQGKHVPLFIAVVFILLVGLVYTAILFSWQWRFYLPRWKIFTVCLRSQKLQLFIETYNAPFTPKHRYWTGLLLIARAILYLVAASNVSNDPQLALSAIVFTMSFVLLVIAFTNLRIYKNMPLNVLETFFILNILLFSIFTWYSLSSTNINQKAVAHTSVLSTFIILVLTILYHVYTYTSAFSKFRKMNLSRMIKKFRVDPRIRAKRYSRPPPDDNLHRFNELLDMTAGPANTNDYNVPLLDQQPVEPTYSVVELPKLQHTNEPVPEEANVRNVPGPDATATTDAGR